MFEFAESSLTPGGKLITFEGIDRSPAFLGFKNDHEFQHHLADNIEGFEFEYGKLPYVFGSYVHSEMLHRLARSGFAYQLSILKPASINMALEYTHCEIVAAGAIPVFRKAYGDNCKHRWSDKPLTECEDTGTVWLDEYDHKPAYKLIEELSKDDAMREDYRKMSLDFYRDHQDSQHVYESLMDKIENNI
jgi:PHP family Zn ribbon phosphoesterase